MKNKAALVACWWAGAAKQPKKATNGPTDIVSYRVASHATIKLIIENMHPSDIGNKSRDSFYREI